MQAAHDRCGATSWPVLDEVVVRGVTGAVDVDTVTRRMLPGGNDVVDADGRPLQPDQVRVQLQGSGLQHAWCGEVNAATCGTMAVRVWSRDGAVLVTYWRRYR